VDIFERHGYELRIAGGAVRDLLMYKQPHDIDFASTATPEQMKEMFNKEEIRMINSKGESHGTITARINDKENFEVTTLRIDVLTDGRHAQVEFTTDWFLDAGRRDLTINSMFLGFDGTVYDYFNGIGDVQNRKVRFVGDAVTRICEDYLRILRYFRFYGRMADEPNNHDPETLKAIEENASGLTGISGERIWGELKKILTGNFKFDLLKTIVDVGLCPYIGLPVNPNMSELELVQARSSDMDIHPVTALTSLLRNEEEMLKLNQRLKLSSYERELGLFVCMNREDKLCEDPLFPYQILLVKATRKENDIREYIEQILTYRGDTKLLSQFQEWEAPKFPINGHHLNSRGITGGRLFHHILEALKKRWINSNFTLSEEQLLDNFEEIVQEVNEQYPNSKQKKKKGSR